MNSHEDRETIITNFDWNQLSLEQLKLIQSQISKAITLKKHNLKSTKDTADIPKNYGYKASLAKVFPDRLRHSLSEYQKCVFIVSLGSKNFIESKRIEACIEWISKNFTSCVVLVGDSVYRLTIEIREGLKGNEAKLKALNAGQEFINECRLLFEQYSENCCFEFRLASKIEKRSEFRIYYDEFQSLYQKNESFQSMVDSFAHTYLNRGKLREAQKIENIKPNHFAITYLLEESALFTSLAKEGWPVFVYPGSIKTFEEISEGLHPEVPEPLKQMIWASVRLKKRGVRVI